MTTRTRNQETKAEAVHDSAAAAAQGAHNDRRVFLLPLVFAAAILLLSMVPRVQESDVLQFSFVGAAVALLLLQAFLGLQLKRRSESARSIKIVLRPQHYVQALVQVSLYIYWGWYWEPVYGHLWLILGQLLFAYGFDMLLSWTKRESYMLGFGPVPIVGSINLFLWFHDDLFYLQFVMIAVGFMGKELVRWRRDGRLVHIFNPSAFALGLFSLILILTGTTDLTWGSDIASTLTLAPHMYLFLFLAGVVLMYKFAITLVAGCAAIVLFGLSELYMALEGVPYFVDSAIPAAVFLGLHLLITDPSTSPRTPLGKAIFGVLYGLGVFGLYSLLGALDVPTFYDKLLCVPLLNLSVIAIDRLAHAIHTGTNWQYWFEDGVPQRVNIKHIAVWIVVFFSATLLGKTDGLHTGDRLPFWQQSCDSGNVEGCERLLTITGNYCSDRSAWACNDLGLHYRRGDLVAVDSIKARDYFSRACELRFEPACVNLLDDEALAAAPPKDLDLRLLLRERGLNLLDMPLDDLHARACVHGWEFACRQEERGR